ncbi:MAG: flavin reductase family protein [Myxococcales bacterium]|nr:flavin reductase family protein [Myxococcales bacterium]
MRVAVPLNKCYRLINHGPVTLVSAAANGQTNVMAAAWTMPLDFDPPKIAVVIGAGDLTRSLIDASRELVVQVPPRGLAEQTDAVGSCTGRLVDKWLKFGLSSEPGAVVNAPLVTGCVAWLECRMVDEPSVEQRYDLLIAEVVAAWADDAVYSVDETTVRLRDDVPEHLRAFHHVAGGAYVADGQVFSVR